MFQETKIRLFCRAALGMCLCAAFLFAFSAKAALVINEINYSPAGADDKHEWLEIYNSGPESIDLTGCKLNDGDTETNHGFNAPPENNSRGQMTLASGSYALLADDAATVAADLPGYSGTIIDTVLNLLNSAAEIKILDKDGVIIASTAYSKDMGGDGNGKTLEWNGTAFAESLADGGTPGATNGTSAPSTPEPSSSPLSSPTPESSRAPAYQFSKEIFIAEFLPNPETSQKEWLELFNAGNQIVDLSGWWLDDANSVRTQSIPEGTKINPGEYLVLTFENSLLNNDGDKIKLVWPDGQFVHVISYGEAKKGWSASRLETRWLWSNQPTPGEPNKKSLIILPPEKPPYQPAQETVDEIQETPIAPAKTRPPVSATPAPSSLPLSASASQAVPPGIPAFWLLGAAVLLSLLMGLIIIYFRRQDRIDSQQ